MKKSQFNKRGGYRKPRKLTTGQSLLLQFIWEKFGGASKVAELLDVHMQDPTNWRVRGKVPLELVGPVSRTLDLLDYALNYTEVSHFYGHTPLWPTVVDTVASALKFDDQEVKKILTGTFPEGYKR